MNYLSFKNFVDKCNLKDEATSEIKMKEILSTLHATGESTIPTGTYMRDDQFTTKSGIVILHPIKGIHWVMLSNQQKFFNWLFATTKHNETKK